MDWLVHMDSFALVGYSYCCCHKVYGLSSPYERGKVERVSKEKNYLFIPYG